MNCRAVILACLLGVAAQCAAQAPAQPRGGAPSAPRPSAPQPAAAGAASLQAGQQIASAGTTNGVTACVSCHGAQGEGNPASGFPRIAGQSAYYLNKQLLSYVNNSRNNPVMSPIAKAMNAQQMRDVSAWYASLAAPAAPAAAGPKASAAAMARGRLLATVGDESKKVQACGNCHGPGGAGEAPTYPYLAGQNATYLTAAMGEWKSGTRKTDPSGQMPAIAKALGDDDVAALSAYFAAQPPPQPAGKMVNIPAGSTAKPAVAAAPGAPGPKAPGGSGVQGTGTEQGAPVTGGSQGPGGGGGTQGTQPPPPPIKK